MALDKINPFVTNPYQGGMNPAELGIGQKKPQGPEGEQQMYGFNGGQKGKLFENFSVPQSQGSQMSFLGQGALGDNAVFGAEGARLGGKLNVIG